MLWLTFSRGDRMDIDIENPRTEVGKIGEPRFLNSFHERHGEYIAFPIRMAAELEPTVEFPVMSKKNLRAILIDDPCGTGDVAFLEGALKARSFHSHKIRET